MAINMRKSIRFFLFLYYNNNTSYTIISIKYKFLNFIYIYIFFYKSTSRLHLFLMLPAEICEEKITDLFNYQLYVMYYHEPCQLRYKY